jgi:hypothetical protein
LALEFVFTLGILNSFKLTLEVWRSGAILLNLFRNQSLKSKEILSLISGSQR